jgi:hypothetical protein
MKKLFLFIALALGVADAPAAANIVVELTFAEKMNRSDLVVVGTVTGMNRGRRGGVGSTATMSVERTLKGRSPAIITVSTSHPIVELDPRCCELGATYLLFLEEPSRGEIYSPNFGAFGMVKVGGPPGVYRVLPHRNGAD